MLKLRSSQRASETGNTEDESSEEATPIVDTLKQLMKEK